MGSKRFNGGLKRHKSHEKKKVNHKNKNQVTQTNIPPSSPTPSVSSAEDIMPSTTTPTAEEEEPMVVYNRDHSISMYDHLLTALGSGNESFASVCRKRRRQEQGTADTTDDEDEEPDDESVDLQEPTMAQSDVAETEEESPDDDDDDDDDDDCDDDDTCEIGQTAIISSMSTSSFSVHLGHILPQPQLLDLPTRKWKFNWELPVVDKPMSKWVGTGESFIDKEIDESSNYGLKSNLYKHWIELYKSSGGTEFHSSRQRQFFSLCNSYRDILHCNKRPFYLKGTEEDSSIRDAYTMHALNHVFRTRDLLKRNDAKLTKLRESNEDESGFLDRGFTRPKVLILLPLKSIAFSVVKRLIQLTPSSHRVNVESRDRFYKEFGGEDIEDNEEDNELSKEQSDSQKSSKPSDYQTLFGGNHDDFFVIGIKFTRRGIKLYSDLYSSDIIVASPVGIIDKFRDAGNDKENDFDYLSSIETLILDHADVISMQNWSYVNLVVEQLNHIPKKQHGTDVMRIRQWYLDGHAQFYRQTILLGFYLTPEMNSLFNRKCLNYQGKVKSVTEYKGVLPKVLLPVRQIYERFDVTSIVDVDDARLDYFAKKVLPKIKDDVEGGTMLFISSYFEFVRVRNLLKSQNASFCLLGEYTRSPDISRARVWFFEGKRKIMLYTERAHFNRRYKIRGIKNLIFYSLPERKEFYPEIINMLEGSEDMSTTVLFSGFDQLRLERIVGKRNTKRLMSSEKRIFVFC